MYKLFIILICSIIISACGAPTDSTMQHTETPNNSPEEPIAKAKTDFSPDKLPADAKKEDIARPKSWAFRGQIDNTHDIYLHITRQEKSPKNGCYEVNGSYYYLQTFSPISITGSYCPEAGRFEFKHNKGETLDELFKGQIDKNTGELKGNWIKISGKGHTLPLALVNVEKQYSKQQLQSFMHQIGKDLSAKQGNPETCSAEAAGIDEAGPFIYRFDPSWSGDISVFSPIQFNCYSEYNSSARGSYEHESYNLLQGEPCTYLYTNASTSTDNGDYETGDGASETSYLSLQVFQEQEPGVFKEITKSAFPSGLKTKWTIENEGPRVECQVSGQQFLLAGKKYKWMGEKFEGY